ncbi:hypothetical protein LCGC14_2598270, partial [marine sediment metagenome]
MNTNKVTNPIRFIRQHCDGKWQHILSQLAPGLSEAIERGDKHSFNPVENADKGIRFPKKYAHEGGAAITIGTGYGLGDGIEVLSYYLGENKRKAISTLMCYLRDNDVQPVSPQVIKQDTIERVKKERVEMKRKREAMKEVSGPVVAIVLVLCSVFVPIAFLGGLTGELFRQFAITISIAVSLSGVVALTMTPALCVLILKQEHKQTARFFLWFNRVFTKITSNYVGAVGFMVRRGALGLLLMIGMVSITIGLWKNTPGSLVPDEDQGYYISAIFLPDGSSLERTEEVVAEVISAVQSNPANENVVAFTGFDFIGGGYKNSAATLFVTQKHWDEREIDTKSLVNELFMKTAHINEALVLAFNPPAIFGLGNTGGFEFYIQNKGAGGPEKLQQAMGLMMAEAQKSPILSGLQTLW